MKTRNILPALAIASALFACNASREVKPTGGTESPSTSTPPAQTQFGGNEKRDSLFLSLERTPCFGTCKAYRIDLYRSGYATYNGRSNVELEGRHDGRVGADTLALILEKATALGFFAMQDVYDGEVTDLPSTHLRIVANGRNKKVMGRVGQPAAFKELVAYVEGLLLPLPWQPVVEKP